MPNLQFSVPASTYLTLVQRGAHLGLSEHLVAKLLVLHAMTLDVSDATLMEVRSSAASDRAARLQTALTARPIGGGIGG